MRRATLPGPILALVGWSGSGKTTLLTALLPALIARGLTVSTLKHAHHDVEPDHPGKDSYRHRLAGAQEVLLATNNRFALFCESKGNDALDLLTLTARMAPADLYLAEGFKSAPVAKLEVYRASLGNPPLWRELSDVIAVAGDIEERTCPLPFLPLSDIGAISNFILTWRDRRLKLGPPLETSIQTGS